MTNIKKLSDQQALNMALWIQKHRHTNWGTWGNYPDLSVTATYLAYDVNPMQINFSATILIGDEEVNVLTESRRIVGKKNDKVMFIETFLENYLPNYKEEKEQRYKQELESEKEHENRVKSKYDFISFQGGLFTSTNTIKSAINSYIMSLDHDPKDRAAMRRILEKKCSK